jgi:flagellar FliJ protein
MAYRFALETVLKHRKRLEEIAQRDYAEAQHAVELTLQRLEEMYRRQDEVREEIARLEAIGGKESLDFIRTMQAFITGHKIRIEIVRLEARTLLQKAEQMQELLIAAAQDKKVLAKLKEKRAKEFSEHMGKLEAKAMDEMTMMRQGWRKK